MFKTQESKLMIKDNVYAWRWKRQSVLTGQCAWSYYTKCFWRYRTEFKQMIEKKEVPEMGLLDRLRRKQPKTQNMRIWLNGFTPIFSPIWQWYLRIWRSYGRRSGASYLNWKLNPMHVRGRGLDVVPVNDDRQRILDKPNEFMTTSEFLEKLMDAVFQL